MFSGFHVYLIHVGSFLSLPTASFMLLVSYKILVIRTGSFLCTYTFSENCNGYTKNNADLQRVVEHEL